MSTQPLDALPLWAIYPLTVAILLAAIVAGYYFARWRGMKAPAGSDPGVSPISAATLALLAFLLAVVVGFAINLNQERRQGATNEANAIGTAWLRAGYLDEPYRTESQKLLTEYTDQRILALQPGQLAASRTRSEQIQQELWTIVEEIVRGGNNTATTGLYVSAVNDVIDLHTERLVVGVYLRVPPLLLIAIYVIAFLTLFIVGMQVGYGRRRSLVALMLFVLVFAVVIYLIADLDRPREGLFQVTQQSMYDLQQQLHAAP